jgi:hypothetical protein
MKKKLTQKNIRNKPKKSRINKKIAASPTSGDDLLNFTCTGGGQGGRI